MQVVGGASASAQGSPGFPSSAGAELDRDAIERDAIERDAIDRFKLACVRLAFFGSKDAGRWTLDGLSPDTATACELEAGQALVDLAFDEGDTGQREDSLAALMRPDPGRVAVAWTVACYRIGDLVPHVLRDYTAARDAVRELAGCGDPAHVAAELVASGGDGVWWTALVRTGSQVRFQLVGPQSMMLGGSHASHHEHAADVEAARARWAAQLASWCTGLCVPASSAAHVDPWSAAGSDGEAGMSRTATAPLAGASIEDVMAAVTELSGVVATIAESVERLERQMGALERQAANASPRPTRRAEERADADPRGVGRFDAGPLGAEPFEAADEPLHRWWPSRRPHVRRSPVPGPGRTGPERTGPERTGPGQA